MAIRSASLFFPCCRHCNVLIQPRMRLAARRADFNGKHHARPSLEGRSLVPKDQQDSASKTNFQTMRCHDEKFLYEALFAPLKDQAARVFDSLAWSFSSKCLFEAINVFDVSEKVLIRHSAGCSAYNYREASLAFLGKMLVREPIHSASLFFGH